MLPFTLDMAESLAKRLEEGGNGSRPKHQVRRAFALLYSREPEPEESRAATRLVREHGIRAFCRALFNSNEFIYVH